jgi:hypothetical protein
MFCQCLNYCNLFAKRNCPQQRLVEKLYLFPKLSTTKELENICKSQCCTRKSLSSDHAEMVLARLRQASQLPSVAEWNVTVPSDRRKCPRLIQSFETIVRIFHRSAESSGISHNLSQSGAFIIDPSWSDFQVGDQTEIIFLLRPFEFTGQKHTLVLKGPGTVRRVAWDRWGIAIEFPRDLRTFEVHRADEL